MIDQARDLLRRHGWSPGPVLGSGMEGTVLALTEHEVAKVWHGRSRTDVRRLERFGAALQSAAVPVAVPGVVALIEEGDLLITIEDRVPGAPLRRDGDPAPLPVSAEEARVMGDALDALSAATVSPGLGALPLLPGDQPLAGPGGFPAQLAAAIERRLRSAPGLLRREIPDLEDVVAAVTGRLRGLPPGPSGLVHGDLIPANVHVEGKQVVGVLDFGFLTVIGDPQFDAAITASVFDMYGPHARESEDALSSAFLQRFGHDPRRHDLYRAAYALLTHACFSEDGTDGHFMWCARMLQRDEVRRALAG